MIVSLMSWLSESKPPCKQRKEFLGAAKKGDVATACRVLDTCPDIVSSTAFLNKKTALHLAAESGHLAILQEVIEFATRRASPKDADSPAAGTPRSFRRSSSAKQDLAALLDAQDCKGRTPLILACGAGHERCVELLLSAGASRLVGDRRGNTPLHYCAVKGFLGLMLQLVTASGEADRRDEAAVPHLGHNADRSVVNWGNTAGFCALHFAVWAKQVGAVQLLLQHGADILVRNHRTDFDVLPVCVNCTPLHLAAYRGLVEMSRTLVRHFAESVVEPLALPVNGVLPPSVVAQDPRQQRSQDGFLPSQIAFRMSHFFLATLLRPDIHLTTLFPAQDRDLRLFGPPSLRALCAVALNKHLCSALASLEASDATACTAAHKVADTVGDTTPVSSSQDTVSDTSQTATAALSTSHQPAGGTPRSRAAAATGVPCASHLSHPSRFSQGCLVCPPLTSAVSMSSGAVAAAGQRYGGMGGGSLQHVPTIVVHGSCCFPESRQSSSSLLSGRRRHLTTPSTQGSLSCEGTTTHADEETDPLELALAGHCLLSLSPPSTALLQPSDRSSPAASRRDPQLLSGRGPCGQLSSTLSRSFSNTLFGRSLSSQPPPPLPDGTGEEVAGRGGTEDAAAKHYTSCQPTSITGGASLSSRRHGTSPRANSGRWRATLPSLAGGSSDEQIVGQMEMESDGDASVDSDAFKEDAAHGDPAVSAGKQEVGGPDDGDEDDCECGVCLEHEATIAVQPCNHSICGSCARTLCSMDPRHISHCPFCRVIIAGFVAYETCKA